MGREVLSDIADDYLGIYEKGGENMGFSDPLFQVSMEGAGWKRGYSWCAVFVKLCLRRALGIDHELVKAMTPGVLASFYNFKNKYSDMITQKPTIGSIVLWRTGNKTGHTGIVSNVLQDGKFETIEGNSDDKVNRKRRNIFNQRKNWTLLGFLTIPDDYFK